MIDFGMYEMERAAERILEVLGEQNNSTFKITDMKTDDELNGVVELILRGWIVKGQTYNGSLEPAPEFFKRCNQGLL